MTLNIMFIAFITTFNYLTLKKYQNLVWIANDTMITVASDKDILPNNLASVLNNKFKCGSMLYEML